MDSIILYMHPYTSVYIKYYIILAEGPGVARKKINFEEKKFLENFFLDFFSLCNPPATHECPQKNSAQSV